MNFRDCLAQAVAAGMLNEAHAKKARQVFDDAERQFTRQFGPTGGPRQAAQLVMEKLEELQLERRRRLLLQRAALKRTQVQIEAATNMRGVQDDGEGLIGLMDKSDLSSGDALRQHTQSVRGDLHRTMVSMLEAFRPTVTGATRNRARLLSLVRELFGENTGDVAAKELAEAFRSTAERARLRFNAAGGAIGKMNDWGMPQSHDSLKVRKASKATWLSFVTERLDPQRMLDNDTGLPFTPERLREVLGEVYDTIATEGWAKRDPAGRALGSTIASRRADPRFLIFKNADAWFEYQTEFGEADPFSTMIGHLDHTAKDIAAMELFGPSPTATLNWIEQNAQKRAAIADAADGGTKHGDRVTKMARLMWNAYDLERGSAARPINGRIANAFYVLRNTLASAQLGSAAIPAFLTDPNFARIAAAMNGLDATRMLGHYVKMLAPGATDTKRLAIRLSLIADNWSQIALAQRRFAGDFMGPAWSKRLSHTVMTMTGLSPHTQAMRWAFGMEFFGTLADHVDGAFNALPVPLQHSFARHGISAADWNAMRAIVPYEEHGAKFLRPDDVAAVNGKLADRLLSLVHTETEHAVPSFSLRGEAHFLGRGTEPGTFAGELVRSGLLYRNFGITLAMTHMRRRMLEFAAAPELSDRARILANGLDLIVTTTLLGALSLQLKQLLTGRDLRPMGENGMDPRFWGAAMMQGGGIGVFGDFLFTGINQYGSGLPETVAGAPIGFVSDTVGLTIGNALQLGIGQDTNFAGEAVQYLKRYTPGSSVWYARLALERLLFDRLDLWANPKASDRMRRLEQKYRNEFGQRYWWGLGQSSPDRAPDLNPLKPVPAPGGAAAP